MSESRGCHRFEASRAKP